MEGDRDRQHAAGHDHADPAFEVQIAGVQVQEDQGRDQGVVLHVAEEELHEAG